MSKTKVSPRTEKLHFVQDKQSQTLVKVVRTNLWLPKVQGWGQIRGMRLTDVNYSV